jgi:hypothetical protein
MHCCRSLINNDVAGMFYCVDSTYVDLLFYYTYYKKNSIRDRNNRLFSLNNRTFCYSDGVTQRDWQTNTVYCAWISIFLHHGMVFARFRQSEIDTETDCINRTCYSGDYSSFRCKNRRSNPLDKYCGNAVSTFGVC